MENDKNKITRDKDFVTFYSQQNFVPPSVLRHHKGGRHEQFVRVWRPNPSGQIAVRMTQDLSVVWLDKTQAKELAHLLSLYAESADGIQP